MKKSNIPQELTNIPFGQIFILTDPHRGITSTKVQQIGAIISIAGNLGQSHIVYALPVDDSELWDCFICKVKTDKGVQILISDKDSLVEMLCEFWGLDYTEACKSLVLGKRYKNIPYGGKSHPIRVSVTTRKTGKTTETGDHTTRLQAITVHTKEGELKRIEDALEESFINGIDISMIDLATLWEKVSKKKREAYQLDIQITPGEEGWSKGGSWVTRNTCDIWIIDEAGKGHPLKMQAQTKALYLTFILFKDGIKLADLKTNKEFYEIYKAICERLKYINNIPDMTTLFRNANRKRAEIKTAIKEVTKDDKKAEMLFAIEGVEGKEFRVEGATDELRDKIRKDFEIE